MSEPASAPPAPVAAAATSPTPSGVGALLSPMAILRYVTLISAIVMFACMADTPFYSGSHTFRYIVAVGVLVFVWCIAAIAILFMYPKVASVVNPVMLQLVVDGLFVVMCFFAAIIGAVKCGSETEYKYYCEHFSTPNAAVAFSFITLVCLIIALVLNFIRYKGTSGAQA